MLFSVSLSVSGIGSEQPVHWGKLVDKTHAQRTKLLNGYYEGGITNFDSSTVFQHISHLKDLALQFDDEQLNYEADLIKAHYYYYSENIDNKIILDSLGSIVRKAEREGVLWLRVRMESLLGHFKYNRLREYNEALLHLARAAELMDDQDIEKFPLKQICNFHIGVALYNFNDYKSALHYLRKAATLDPLEGMPDYSVNVVNTIGMIYRDQNRLDSSDYYFKKAISIGERRGHKVWTAIAKGNLGHNYYLREDYDRAMPLLKQDAEMAKSQRDWGLASNALTLIGDIYLKRGNRKAARGYLLEAQDMAHRSGKIKRLEFVYPRLAKLKAAQGEAETASKYIDSAEMARERIERSERKMLMSRSQQKLAREQYLGHLERLELEKEKKVLERNLLIASIIAFIAAALYLYTLLWNKYKRKRIQLKRKNKELKEAKKGLYKITENLAERNRQIDIMREKAKHDSSNTVSELQQKSILTHEDWEEFQELFEQAYPGFLTRLRANDSGFTQSEIRFLALKKLELTAKKMARVLGVGGGAIRQYRYRIRKKLSFTSDDELKEYVDHI